LTEELTRRVVEVGFCSGLNADYYPAEVELVLAVEPAAVARKLAEKRISRSAATVEHVGMDGQSIPLDDNRLTGRNGPRARVLASGEARLPACDHHQGRTAAPAGTLIPAGR